MFIILFTYTICIINFKVFIILWLRIFVIVIVPKETKVGPSFYIYLDIFHMTLLTFNILPMQLKVLKNLIILLDFV